MSERWYKHWLWTAAFAERQHDLATAVRALNKAESHTFDEEELRHLRMWRARLEAEMGLPTR